jgi:hypothetical protein
MQFHCRIYDYAKRMLTNWSVHHSSGPGQFVDITSALTTLTQFVRKTESSVALTDKAAIKSIFLYHSE